MLYPLDPWTIATAAALGAWGAITVWRETCV
jgi:hypothetical protein